MTQTEPRAARIDPDRIIERLRSGERRWAGLPLAQRREILLAFGACVGRVADEWVHAATAIKRLPVDSPLVGEEWMSGPYAVLSYVDALQATLQRLADGADVLAGHPVTVAPGGRLAVRVLPGAPADRLLLSGFGASVWTRPGVSEEELRAGAGLAMRHPERTRGVAVVLGAGNISSIAPLDVLHQRYAENRTAVLKLNPVTDPLADVLRAAFRPMIELELVEIVTGGADVGSALIEHAGTAAVHVTGSEATHDAIMWGSGPDAASAKAAGVARLQKPMTSELGGVSPVIIVPGRWSRADLLFQAEHVATQRLHNSGCNCVASQVVVLSADWPQREQFLIALERALVSAPGRPAWYPGCADRVAEARRAHPAGVAIGGTPERTLLPGLDPADRDESAFTTEYFGPVLGVTELPGDGVDFLDAAVAFANERLRGTLGANIIVDPRTRRALGDRFEAAVTELRYGTIGINAWTGVGYLTPRATWGAFPGHTPDDIQSGSGVVHNALLLPDTERTVVTGPFRPAPRSLLHGEWALSPRPPWFLGNRTAALTARRLTRFAARPRWRSLPGIVSSAFRG